MYGIEDTIAAISTSLGEGAIGIVRMSGADARRIAGNLFVPAQRHLPWQSHHLYYGHIVEPDTGQTVDEVLVGYMQSPHSYTREDVVEINCHGGIVALQRILRLCLREGARQALPGEFTLRAFLNGRLDLSQAEAVLDVVRAKTESALRQAVGQLEGRLSARVKALRAKLLESLAYLTATIDFTEQEIPFRDISPELAEVRESLCELLRDADRGIIYRQGVRAAIIGRPNVGKSSLLNALLRTNRAIVTPIPGTTRDTLEETLNLEGVPVLLVDTAGLNVQTEDMVEQLGIERSRSALQAAHVVLWVIDGSEPLTKADLSIASLLVDRLVLIVINKSDLPLVAQVDGLLPESRRVHLSALTGAGLPDLERSLLDAVLGSRFTADDAPLVNSLRHKQAIERALNHVVAAAHSQDSRWPADCITIDLAAACDALGEITGEHVSDSLLETIFGSFCIGK